MPSCHQRIARAVVACEERTHATTIIRGGSALDELLRARHRVFVDEMGYHAPRADGRFQDARDLDLTTRNVAVSCAGRIVAGIRLADTTRGPCDLEELFAFSEHLPAGSHAAAGSMFFVESAHRGDSLLLQSLLTRFHRIARDERYSHVFGAVAPAGERALLRCGYRPLASRFFHDSRQLWVLPVILDMKEIV